MVILTDDNTHSVAPHAGARIEICKTRSGRHERKIAPHALTVPHFWALRAVQMCTVFATECCVYSGLLYGANLQFKCNSYKKDIHKRYCKKQQNIAGDRKWMPTVILRQLNEVA